MLFLFLACAPPATFSVEAELDAEIPAVIDVWWTTDATEPGGVAFGTDDGDRLFATGTQDPDGTWHARLIGVPADAEVWYAPTHGEDVAQARWITTGQAPLWVPDDPETSGTGAPGFVVTGARTSDGRGSVILDRLGRPVWWASIEAFGRDTYTSRSWLDASRTHVWVSLVGSRFSPDTPELTEGVWKVPLDGGEAQVIELPGHHHDMVLHDDDSVAYLSAYDDVVDGVEVEVDTLMLRHADGTTEEVWSTRDLLGGEMDHAWLNTVEYVAETDTYWVGARGLSTIFQVDATTGSVRTTLGGSDAEVRVDLPLEGQHGFDVVGDELVVFNNGSASDGNSRGVRYDLDFDQGRARATMTHGADPEAYSTVLGDALDMGAGRTLVNWTTAGLVQQVDADGAMYSEWAYDDGDMLTYMKRVGRVVP